MTCECGSIHFKKRAIKKTVMDRVMGFLADMHILSDPLPVFLSERYVYICKECGRIYDERQIE